RTDPVQETPVSDNSGQYRFEVIGKIGSGSLFTVYRARDLLLNKPVALKVLRRQYAQDEGFAAALKDCGRRAMKLTDEHVGRILAVGQEGEHVFQATELLGERTLHELLVAEAPLQQDRALSLFLQICTAVDHAHRRQCPHGDLRPHNVFLTDSGRVKVADFGVASAFSEAKVSQTDALLRSIHYLAPERTQGAPASVAADVYSLGALLYQMLTGAVPFDAVSPLSIARKHANQPPAPMQSLNPRVAQTMEEVVRRCLEKDPRARYPSVDALITHLQALLTAPPADPREMAPERGTHRRPRGARHWAVGALSSIVTSVVFIALCGGLAFGAFWLYRRSAPKDIEVPDVIGKTRSAAEADLQRAGLLLRVAREEYSAEVPTGQVTHTEPAAGMRVKEGRIVSAVLSRGAELILVPDVRQASLQRAKDLLTQVELVPGEVREDYDEVIPEGYVSRQSPPARSRAPKGSQVALQVSKGRAAGAPAHEGDTADVQPPGPKKRARIRMRVPAGAERQEVRFLISDDQGDHVAYEKVHAPGDEIAKTVGGRGEQVRLRIFLDGKLVRDKSLE
ncbi:MAG: hypothetical protein COY42_06930, partial [Armatimonadetes bacterium CG_4_10_14_0_8_um_filter_66_14]